MGGIGGRGDAVGGGLAVREVVMLLLLSSGGGSEV